MANRVATGASDPLRPDGGEDAVVESLGSSPAAASNITSELSGHFEKNWVRPRLRLNFSGELGSD
jgi:hypothetical protein